MQCSSEAFLVVTVNKEASPSGAEVWRVMVVIGEDVVNAVSPIVGEM